MSYSVKQRWSVFVFSPKCGFKPDSGGFWLVSWRKMDLNTGYFSGFGLFKSKKNPFFFPSFLQNHVSIYNCCLYWGFAKCRAPCTLQCMLLCLCFRLWVSDHLGLWSLEVEPGFDSRAYSLPPVPTIPASDLRLVKTSPNAFGASIPKLNIRRRCLFFFFF